MRVESGSGQTLRESHGFLGYGVIISLCLLSFLVLFSRIPAHSYCLFYRSRKQVADIVACSRRHLDERHRVLLQHLLDLPHVELAE